MIRLTGGKKEKILLITMNKIMLSEIILKYKMNPNEIKAMNLALIWEKYCNEEFPNERHVKLRKNSDPRKSNLFKYCYKAIRELKSIIDDKDLHLYVKAQLQILKLVSDGKIHSLIEPQILVGEKAWKRWKIWKRSYDKKINKHLIYEQLGIQTSPSKIKVLLNKNFEFLVSNKCNEFKNFTAKAKDQTINRWIATGQISPYYLVLSPYCSKSKEFLNLEIDFALYKPSITPEIENFFKEKFFHEFT